MGRVGGATGGEVERRVGWVVMRLVEWWKRRMGQLVEWAVKRQVERPVRWGLRRGMER